MRDSGIPWRTVQLLFLLSFFIKCSQLFVNGLRLSNLSFNFELNFYLRGPSLFNQFFFGRRVSPSCVSTSFRDPNLPFWSKFNFMAVLIRLPAIWMLLGLKAALVISFCSAETVVGEPHAVDPSIPTPYESSEHEQDQTLASSNIEENAVEAGNDFGSHPADLPVVSGPSSGIQYEEYNQMSEEFDRLMSQNGAQAEIESVVESFDAQNAFEEAAPTESVVNYPMNQENRIANPDIVAQDAVPVWEPEHQSDNQNVKQNNVDSTMSSFEEVVEETIVEQDSTSGDAESRNAGDFPEQEATGGNYANPIHSQAIADATKPGSTCSREVTCVRGAPSDQCFAHQLLCLQRLGLLPDEEADASDYDDDDSAEEGEGEGEDEEETEIPPREEMQTRRYVQSTFSGYPLRF
jgi:hypothetical protein